MGSYCYIIKQRNNYYIGQSVTALDKNEYFKNRMYTHALAACNINSYGYKILDFRNLREGSSKTGIDKLWYENGFKDCEYWIFDNPGINSLKKSSQMLLNYGFYAGSMEERTGGDNMAAGYSADLGELLLIDFYAKHGKTAFGSDSKMLNDKAGGQGKLKYNPYKSRWGREILKNEEFKKAAPYLKKNERRYACSLASGKKDVSRLSKFLSNPTSDAVLFKCTTDFIHDILMYSCNKQISSVIASRVAYLVCHSKEKVTNEVEVTPALKKAINDMVQQLQSAFNHASTFISIKFNIDWSNAKIDVPNMRTIIKNLKSYANNTKFKNLAEVEEFASRIPSVITKELEGKAIKFEFSIVAPEFKFNCVDTLESTLDKEIGENKQYKDTEVKQFVAMGILDAFKYYIYKAPWDKTGQLYQGSTEQTSNIKAIKYVVSGSSKSFKEYLRNNHSNGLPPSIFSDEGFFEAVYSCAMYQYRKTLNKEFYITDNYLFSNIDTDITNLSIPEGIKMVKAGEGTVPISSANYTYFIKPLKMRISWVSLNSQGQDIEEVMKYL